MKTQVKHTATPLNWGKGVQFAGFGELRTGKHIMTATDGDLDDSEHFCRVDDWKTERGKARMDLIQRAVNAHDYLVEAAKRNAENDCECDVLNPCWNNRPNDKFGKHWGMGDACGPCTAKAALAKAAPPVYIGGFDRHEQ